MNYNLWGEKKGLHCLVLLNYYLSAPLLLLPLMISVFCHCAFRFSHFNFKCILRGKWQYCESYFLIQLMFMNHDSHDFNLWLVGCFDLGFTLSLLRPLTLFYLILNAWMKIENKKTKNKNSVGHVWLGTWLNKYSTAAIEEPIKPAVEVEHTHGPPLNWWKIRWCSFLRRGKGVFIVKLVFTVWA